MGIKDTEIRGIEVEKMLDRIEHDKSLCLILDALDSMT